VKYAVLAGRQLFSIIFITASAGHFSQQTIESAARHGVPMAALLVPVSGVIALMGGLSVLVGFQTRLGAWLLVLFLVPVTLVMHNFWAAPDAITFQIEQAMFMKNLTMLGGALLISYFGAGPLSLDAFISGERPLIDEFRRRSPQPAGE
jgi:putative oxidoreductase